MKKIEVVAGIICFENKILCVQRAKSKLEYISEKFEFPGGKIESGESNEEALLRELEEELSIHVSIDSIFMTNHHIYPDFELTMHSYLCRVDDSKLELKEHIDKRWLSINELQSLDWAAADIPIVDKLMKNEK